MRGEEDKHLLTHLVQRKLDRLDLKQRKRRKKRVKKSVGGQEGVREEEVACLLTIDILTSLDVSTVVYAVKGVEMEGGSVSKVAPSSHLSSVLLTIVQR